MWWVWKENARCAAGVHRRTLLSPVILTETVICACIVVGVEGKCPVCGRSAPENAAIACNPYRNSDLRMHCGGCGRKMPGVRPHCAKSLSSILIGPLSSGVFSRCFETGANTEPLLKKCSKVIQSVLSNSNPVHQTQKFELERIVRVNRSMF